MTHIKAAAPQHNHDNTRNITMHAVCESTMLLAGVARVVQSHMPHTCHFNVYNSRARMARHADAV